MFNHQHRVLFLLLLLIIITFPLLTSAQTTNQSLIDSLYQQVLLLKAKLTASFSPTSQLAAISGSVTTGLILYVDDSAPLGGDGTSWSSAYKFLQDALLKIQNSPVGTYSEIRIAQGIYRPDHSASNPNGSMNRSDKFYLDGARNINGVAIRGGYAGYGAPSPDMRDINQYETVLSGDLRSDDTEDPNSWVDNS